MSLNISFDPLDKPASLRMLKEAVAKILELPVSTAGGLVYQFSSVDEAKMQKAQRGLSLMPGATISWRQLNNSETNLDASGLLDLMVELNARQFRRGLVVDSEYMAMKLNGNYTLRQLANWEAKYSNGFIPVPS